MSQDLDLSGLFEEQASAYIKSSESKSTLISNQTSFFTSITKFKELFSPI